jgi:hypothetical protein
LYEEQRTDLPVPAISYPGPDLSPFTQGDSFPPAVSTAFAGGTLERSYLFTTWLLPENRIPDIFLENSRTAEKVSLATSGTPTSGFFVNYRAVDSSATLYGNEHVDAKPRRWPPVLRKTAANLSAPGSGWRVGMRWYQPVSIADIPVSLNDTSIPFWEGGPEKPAKAFSRLRIASGSTDREIRSLLRRAWFLSCEAAYAHYVHATKWDGRRGSGYDRAAEWQRFLADCEHRHLPILMEMLEELPADDNRKEDGSGQIMQRIRELLLPSDAPGIRQQFPTAAGKLKDLLPGGNPGSAAPANGTPAAPR